jgi:CRISPR-associated protein Cas6
MMTKAETKIQDAESFLPYINASFALSGKQLPADHGHLVYSAISKAFPALHSVDWLGIELISGFPSGPGLIALTDRGATLRLRIPADHYRDVLPLAGKRLDIGGHQLRLGRAASLSWNTQRELGMVQIQPIAR